MQSMINVREVVIIIDDDSSVREALAGLLETIGLDGELYGSAEEFLKAKRRDVPTCVVLGALGLTGAILFACVVGLKICASPQSLAK
jgi:FixJ family two-component response regulator